MENNIEYFFAASNGYSGFQSYFDEVFSPSDYERIFILKGGPGTGKSRFIKDVIDKFSVEKLKMECVLCASDTSSRDGVIIENEIGKKIAIVDGTAPHATDPVYPGAVERIVNLGDSWNTVLLKNNKAKIKELTDRKKESYNNAYQLLSVAGLCDTLALDAVISAFSGTCAKEILSILEKIKPGSGKKKTRLKSAFGRQGFFELDAPFCAEKIKVVGIYGSEYLFMKKLLNSLDLAAPDVTVFPSPLDKKRIDAIYFEASDLYVYAATKKQNDSTITVDTSKYVDIKKFKGLENKAEAMYKERETMLWCATDEFKKAYDAHMETEKIYTAAMNFKKNEKELLKVCEEIRAILLPESEI